MLLYSWDSPSSWEMTSPSKFQQETCIVVVLPSLQCGSLSLPLPHILFK